MSLLDVLVRVAVGFVRGLFALVPSVDLPDFGSAAGNIGAAVATVDGVFPVVTLGVCVLAVFASRLVIIVVEISIKVYELIPFKAT